MYKLAIILRYLRSKLAPVFAILAVALCTAMVIIVISIMGGFLEMMQGATHTLEGDVIVYSEFAGFTGYEEVIDKLRADKDLVAGAAPAIQTFGLLKLADGLHKVEVIGIDPASLETVMDYRAHLYWDAQRVAKDKPLGEDFVPLIGRPEENPRALGRFMRERDVLARQFDLRDLGMFPAPPPSGEPSSPAWQNLGQWAKLAHSIESAKGPLASDAIVIGMEVSNGRKRDSKGQYHLGTDGNLGREATLSVLPITEEGGLLDPSHRKLVVVNEFKSGLFQIDETRVYVPFTLLQSMLKMKPEPEVDLETAKPTGKMLPGRVTHILVKAQPGRTLDDVKNGVEEIAQRVLPKYPGNPPIYIQTWKGKYATFLSAVANEKLLVTILFAIVSIVAFTMIAVVFYMIVLAKTRDIGTIRAMGASRLGVAGIFLGYGLVVGIIGSLVGLGVASLIVNNINEIQDFLGRTIGWEMWKPEIYYFDRIPSQLNPREVGWIIIAAIGSSVLGAVIPAIRAARQNPVESLRYE